MLHIGCAMEGRAMDDPVLNGWDELLVISVLFSLYFRLSSHLVLFSMDSALVCGLP